MNQQSTKSNFGKWGWSMIAYCAISYYLAASLATDTLNYYPAAFTALRGWDASVADLCNVMSGIGGWLGVFTAFIFSTMTAKKGSKFMAVLGNVVSAGLTVIFALTKDPKMFLAMVVAISCITGNIQLNLVPNNIMNIWFPKKKGLALGWASMGLPLCTATIVVIFSIIGNPVGLGLGLPALPVYFLCVLGDTQAKVAKIKAGVRNGAKAAGHYALVGAKTAIAGISIALVYAGKWALTGLKATGRGIVVAMKATLQGLLHMKSTAKRLYRLSRVGMRKLKAWNKRRKRQARLSKLKRERAYRQFKANGGIKGVLLNTSNSIKNRIAVFMEEDQDEPGEEAVTEDDLFEESLERGAKEGSKPMEIGKNIVSRVKDLVDPE